MLRLAVFQYLPFVSYALPLAPIGALGIGVLPKSHPTIIYPQIAFGAAIACPRSRLAGHAAVPSTYLPLSLNTTLFSSMLCLSLPMAL